MSFRTLFPFATVRAERSWSLRLARLLSRTSHWRLRIRSLSSFDAFTRSRTIHTSLLHHKKESHEISIRSYAQSSVGVPGRSNEKFNLVHKFIKIYSRKFSARCSMCWLCMEMHSNKFASEATCSSWRHRKRKEEKRKVYPGSVLSTSVNNLNGVRYRRHRRQTLPCDSCAVCRRVWHTETARH